MRNLELTREEPQRQAGTDRGFWLDERMAGGPSRQDTSAGRTKIFGDAMRHVLPHMTSESAEMPQFFQTVEKLFVVYDFPDDIKSKLLIPVLTAQAKALVNRMSVECMGEYSELKSFLLAEYKLTPREYKVRFDTTTRVVMRHMCCLLRGYVTCCHTTLPVMAWEGILISYAISS